MGEPAEIDRPFVPVVDSDFVVVGYMRMGCGQPSAPTDSDVSCEILDGSGAIIGHFVDGRPVIGG